jgi:DNA-binding Xre family transcriptional regulator
MATVTKGEALFAPAAPFAQAIGEWQANYRKQPRAVRCARTQPNAPDRKNGIEELARISGVPSRRLRAYQTGESQWIHIDNADRLCMALGVALWVLADDFRTMKAWSKEAAA